LLQTVLVLGLYTWMLIFIFATGTSPIAHFLLHRRAITSWVPRAHWKSRCGPESVNFDEFPEGKTSEKGPLSRARKNFCSGDIFRLLFFLPDLGSEKTSQLGRVSVRHESKTEQPRRVPDARDAIGEYRTVG
jgi:hypothetical protein